jgi:HlyD family secretion protein
MMSSGGKWAVRILAGLAVLGLVLLVAMPRAVDVETSVVRRGEFRETIRSDGYLRSKERYTVPAFATGDIKRVDLKVGDVVKKGQVITHLYWDVSWDPVRAPISGVISRLFRESAGPIQRGEPIVEIVDPDRLEAVAELLTTDATRLTPGNRAWIESWGGAGALEARVSRISKAGFTKQSALGVEEERTEVTMDLVSVPVEISRRLGSTFHVEVGIEVSVHPDALQVPAGSVFRDGDSWAVYRVESGRAKAARVTVGARSGQEVLISSGLSEGDRVVVFPGDLVRDGTRIQFQ